MKTELLERKKELERQLALLKDKKAKEYIPGRGYVPHQRLLRVDGKLVDIFELPEDQEVFNTIAEGKTETVFQFSTPSARMWLKEFDYEKEPGKKAFTSIKDLSAFTALDRPGPLDAKVGGENGHNMLVEFANRAKGLPATDPIPVLDELLPETYGVIVFQESLQQVYQYLTGCTGSEAETFRRYIARKKMDKVDAAYPNFIEQASKKVGKEAAERIWDQIKTFGQYGFNMSHSLCYSDTGYVCAFLKYHHFLEWWAGVLKNANKNEIASTFWGFIKDHVDMPDITVSKEDWTVVDGRLRAPLGFLAGVGEKAGVELEKGRPYKDIADFVAKIEKTKDENSYFDEKRGRRVRGRSALHRGIVCKLIVAGAMDSLFPEGLSDIEKIDMYLEESANARKIKKEAVPKEYLDLDPLTRYQFRKSILPIYSESLVDAVYSVGGIEMNKEVKEDGSTVYSGTDPRGNVFRFVNGRHLRLLEKAPITVDVAVAAYVLDERQFSYGADKSKKAVSYSFDIDGEVFEFVAWADRKGNIKTPVNTKGSIVVVALNKWNKDRPFAIKEVVVVRSSS